MGDPVSGGGVDVSGFSWLSIWFDGCSVWLAMAVHGETYYDYLALTCAFKDRRKGAENAVPQAAQEITWAHGKQASTM
jgi:hypothetical protein